MTRTLFDNVTAAAASPYLARTPSLADDNAGPHAKSWQSGRAQFNEAGLFFGAGG